MGVFGPFGAFFVPAWKPAWMLRALLSVEDGTFHADGSTELLIIFAKAKKQSKKHGKNNSSQWRFCLVCFSFSHPFSLCRTMTDPRMAVGASVWVKGSCVTNDCELHRCYGSNAKTIYIPGIVTRGFLQPSQRGRNMKYIEAVFYYGGSDTKSATVPMSQVKWELPILAPYPEGLDLFRADKGVVRMQGLDSPSTASSVTMDPTAARDELK
jgi:hypothetical protein